MKKKITKNITTNKRGQVVVEIKYTYTYNKNEAVDVLADIGDDIDFEETNYKTNKQSNEKFHGTLKPIKPYRENYDADIDFEQVNIKYIQGMYPTTGFAMAMPMSFLYGIMGDISSYSDNDYSIHKTKKEEKEPPLKCDHTYNKEIGVHFIDKDKILLKCEKCGEIFQYLTPFSGVIEEFPDDINSDYIKDIINNIFAFSFIEELSSKEKDVLFKIKDKCMKNIEISEEDKNNVKFYFNDLHRKLEENKSNYKYKILTKKN